MNEQLPAIPEKELYRLREVCEYTGTQPYILRFWESEFPQLAPRTGHRGQRLYTRRDIDLILRIKDLLHREACTIAAARERLQKELDAGEPARARRPSGGGPREPDPNPGALERRVAELERRWRAAEQALAEAERALAREQERRQRAARKIEALLGHLETLGRHRGC